MKLTWVLVIALLSVSCKDKPTPPPPVRKEPVLVQNPPTPPAVDEPARVVTVYNQDVLKWAVLRALREKLLDVNENYFEVQHVTREEGLRLIKEQRRRLECINAWIKTQPNEQLRDTYTTYSDVYTRQCDEAEKFLTTPPTKRQESTSERLDREMAAGARLKIPKPKDCVGQE